MTKSTNTFLTVSFSHNIQDWIYFAVSIIIGLIIGVSQIMLIVLLLQPFITIYLALFVLFNLSFLTLCKEFIINLLKFKLKNIFENSIAAIIVAYMVSALSAPIVLLVNENLTLIEDFFTNPKSYYLHFSFVFFILVFSDSTKNAWLYIIKPKLDSHATHKLSNKTKESSLKTNFFAKQFHKSLYSLAFGLILIFPLLILLEILNKFSPNLANIIQPTISQICFFLLFILFLLPFQVIQKNPEDEKTHLTAENTIKTFSKNKEEQ